MSKSKKNIITENNFNEWLSSVGFLFPGNLIELARFEKLYNDFNYQLNEECVDPFKIIENNTNSKAIHFKSNQETNQSENLRFAARNFDSLPDHILKKIKKNQNGLNQKEKGSSDEKDS